MNSDRGEFAVTHRHTAVSALSQQKVLFDCHTHELIDAAMADFFGEPQSNPPVHPACTWSQS
jgi:hypothetical protein